MTCELVRWETIIAMTFEQHATVHLPLIGTALGETEQYYVRLGLCNAPLCIQLSISLLIGTALGKIQQC
jgi:hypothetical protein